MNRRYDGNLKSTTFFLDNATVVGALCVNSGKGIRLVKQALLHGMDITPRQLADPAIRPKSHLTKRIIQA